ncbi:DUF421 domain-containing protein [Sphingopyxis sp. MWB1]|uniref:DUF421 domain-containing protein n=1 Tax=Sphingopyxis sp. MWB1 TaxID=1537715 RepID=UPI00051A29C8|nr:YetF domain-containing protein [Sphingopyxis sp. MWB1]
MFYDNLFGLLRVVVISITAYTALILILRAAGKRALSKLNAFDLVVTVALGSTLSTVLLSGDIAFAEGALAFAMLALLQWLVAKLSIHSDFVQQITRAKPRLLMRDGEICADALRDERVTRAEVYSAIRGQGIARTAEVAAVVLETDGSLSVIARPAEGQVDVLDFLN